MTHDVFQAASRLDDVLGRLAAAARLTRISVEGLRPTDEQHDDFDAHNFVCGLAEQLADDTQVALQRLWNALKGRGSSDRGLKGPSRQGNVPEVAQGVCPPHGSDGDLNSPR